MVFAETPIWLENNWRKVNQQIAQRHLTAMAYSETRSNERKRHGNKIHAMIIESYPTKTHPCELVSNYIHILSYSYIHRPIAAIYIYSYIIKTNCQHQQQLSLFIIYSIIIPFVSNMASISTMATWPPPQPPSTPTVGQSRTQVRGGWHGSHPGNGTVTGTPHGWTNEFH